MVALHNSLSPLKLKRFLKPQSPPQSPLLATPDQTLLPNHIIHEIGRHSALRELSCLSLCSHRLRKLLAPLLYARVELKTNKHCKTILSALSRQPALALLVRRLVVRVNNPEWTDPGDEIDEDVIAALITQIASAGWLKPLIAFEWDGLEMPHDNLWLSLQVSCPNLKRIRTTVGEEALNPSSPLWEFSDLRQFGLTVKCHSLHWLADGLPKPEKLPRKLWAMLLERSPRLEDLTLGGPAPSPRIFDIRHVTCGRWARLRSVTLGDMALISAERGDEIEARKAFQTFFHFHRELRHIGLEHASSSAFFPGAFEFGPVEDSPDSVDVLPKLESYSGSLKYIKTLPSRTRRQLKYLRLTCIHHNVAAIGPTINVLRDLTTLEELSAWIDLSFGSTGLAGGTRRSSLDGISIGRGGDQNSMNDDEKVFRAVLDACPGSLKHLEIACFTRPGFLIKDFSSALTHAPPSLESFTLTKVHRSGDEDLTRCAARIITENPGLKNFTLRMTHGSWFSAASGYGRIKSLGAYEVVSSPPAEEDMTADEFGRLPECLDPASQHVFHPGSTVGCAILHPADGEFHQAGYNLSIPTALIAHEWGQKGISLTGKEFVRSVIYKLTEKELESCRVQMRDLVWRRMEVEAVSYSVASGAISRRSSSASSVRSWPAQRYGFAQLKQGQLAPSQLSFNNPGYRLEQLSSSGISPGRRNRHKHSSSMSAVPQASNQIGSFDYRFRPLGSMRYKHYSITWADQHARTARSPNKDSHGVRRDADDYVFV